MFALQLPYYIDEEKGLRLAHMLAVMRHIARDEHGLIVNPYSGSSGTGDGDVAATRQDMAEQQIQDFCMCIVQLVYEHRVLHTYMRNAAAKPLLFFFSFSWYREDMNSISCFNSHQGDEDKKCAFLRGKTAAEQQGVHQLPR